MTIELEQAPKVGVFTHGRHLETPGWHKLVWGEPKAQKLGVGPRSVLAMLDEGYQAIALMTVGSGSSTRADGRVEAEVIKDLLLEDFNDLEAFDVIREHPEWGPGRLAIQRILEEMVPDVVSQTTDQEVAAADLLFASRGITKVIQVACASHAPRCQSNQSILRENQISLRESGLIVPSMRWQLVVDDMTYFDVQTPAGEAPRHVGVKATTIFESPHRKDRPESAWPLQPNKVFARYFDIPADAKLPFLTEVEGAYQRIKDQSSPLAQLVERAQSADEDEWLAANANWFDIEFIQTGMAQGFDQAMLGKGLKTYNGQGLGEEITDELVMTHPDGRVVAMYNLRKFYSQISASEARGARNIQYFRSRERFEAHAAEHQITYDDPVQLANLTIEPQNVSEFERWFRPEEHTSGSANVIKLVDYVRKRLARAS